jgi:hypothetical protein
MGLVGFLLSQQSAAFWTKKQQQLPRKFAYT